MEGIVVKTEPMDDETPADHELQDYHQSKNLLCPQLGLCRNDLPRTSHENEYNQFKLSVENHRAMNLITSKSEKSKDSDDCDEIDNDENTENESDAELPIKQEIKEEVTSECEFSGSDNAANDVSQRSFSQMTDDSSQPLDYSISTSIKQEDLTQSDNSAVPTGSNDEIKTQHNVAGAFSCLWPTCLERFPDHVALLAHLKYHQLHPNQCQMCLRILENEHDYHQHMALHQYGCSYFCDYKKCTAGFELESQLVEHRLSHTRKSRGAGQHECPQCGKIFPYKVHLKKHKREHRLNDPIICTKDGCNRTFPTLDRLRQHEENYHEHYECLFCNRVFPILKKLNQHMRTTHGSNTKFMCTHEGCDKGFKVKDSLRKHLLSHSAEKTYTCEDCGVSFKYDHTLRNHRRKESQNSEYPCPINGCTEVFKKGCMLKMHKAAVHNATTDITCGKCGLVMPVKDLQNHNKSVHNLVHSTEKVVQCPIEGCESMFTSKEGIRIHKRRYHKRRAMMLQNMEKKLSREAQNNVKGSIYCTSCGLKFQTDANLDEHLKEENSVMATHMCTIKNCRRTYSTRCMLKMHQFFHHLAHVFGRSQNPKRPYACPYDGCQSCFCHSKGLKRHFTMDHKYWESDEVLPCPEEDCEAMFKFKLLLEDHVLLNHKEQAPLATENLENSGSVQGIPESSAQSSEVACANEQFMGSEEQNAPQGRDNSKCPGDHPVVKKPIHCYVCGRFCTNMKAIRRHLVLTHHHVAQLLCTFPECGLTFNKIQSFMQHRRVHIPEAPDGIPPMATVTSKYSEKLPKCYDDSALAPYNGLCSHCGKSFPKKKSYLRHIRIVHGTKTQMFTCDYEGCSKSFSVRAYLTKHIREQHVKNGPTEFPCKYPGCNKTYKSRGGLSRHKNLAHSDKPRPKELHTCSLLSCKAEFTSKEKLRLHMEMHSGSYDCKICGKSLSSNYSLRMHLSHHSTPRNFQCEVDGCEKSFHHEKELQRHMRYHEGLRRHPCPEPGCTALFHFPCQIPKHLERHRDGRVFNCVECNKNFTSYENLKRHQAVAHGPIPPAKKMKERKRVTCPEPNCYKTLGSNYRLRRHIARVHKKTVVQFVCPVERCMAIFPDREQCMDHLRGTHSGEDATVEPLKFEVPIHKEENADKNNQDDDSNSSRQDRESDDEDSRDNAEESNVIIKREAFNDDPCNSRALTALQTELSYLAETDSCDDSDADVAMGGVNSKEELPNYDFETSYM